MRFVRSQDLRLHVGYLRVLALALSLLWCDMQAWAENEYETINTGIEAGGGCWVDDSHFIVEKRVQRQGSQESDLEGLYVLDPIQPHNLQRISLSPLEADVQKRVWSVSCQDGHIIFLTPSAMSESSRLYRLKIGAEPELVVDMRLPRVSLKGQYVLGNNRKALADGDPLKGVFEDNTDCQISYSLPSFKVLCSDWWFIHQWPLGNFILSEYQWRDTITVIGDDGKRKNVPYPQKPRLDQQGKPKRYELFLRDLTGKILRDLGDDPEYGVMPIGGITTSFDERYLFIVCGKRGQKFSNVPYVCRYPLDGQQHQWQEVVGLPTEQMRRGSIRGISVNKENDIAFFIAGATHPDNGIWMHKVSANRLIHVTTPDRYVSDEVPRISPDGRIITFMRKGILMLARQKGARP